MKTSDIFKKLIDVAEGKIEHRLIDCSQPCGTPDEFHDVKNCKACKILAEAKKCWKQMKKAEQNYSSGLPPISEDGCSM